MTDQTNRTLTAGEILFSIDFVVKVAKKVLKDNPAFTPEQVANAIEVVYHQKLTAAEKQLVKIEATRAKYNALRAAEDTVTDTAELIRKLADREVVDYAAQVIVPKPGAEVKKPAASKANGKAADTAQVSMSL